MDSDRRGDTADRKGVYVHSYIYIYIYIYTLYTYYIYTPILVEKHVKFTIKHYVVGICKLLKTLQWVQIDLLDYFALGRLWENAK